ncbi:MAG: methylthioribose-1-phosphate isomerase [marine bacterium B5-7]|nr:MAG: methylthioribose-1-phosphate isomerase [marine bacterium B5-7]
MIIDQTRLPHDFECLAIDTLEDAEIAIRDMQVRGAPLIGACAAYGLALALKKGDVDIDQACSRLLATRPTAVNLSWALNRLRHHLSEQPATANQVAAAFGEADRIANEDVAINSRIGDHGLELIRRRFETTDSTVNILTHCNAGWLATVDWGTALAPIYKAHDAKIPVHVWVDETRPRNQGAALTTWELMNHGVPCTLIADNAGGHLMQQGQVDLCIVGSDRTIANGDVCNKIGTYLKALAAYDNNVPFYVALPTSTIDRDLADSNGIPIEERNPREVLEITGANGELRSSICVAPTGTRAANPAFDITPARLVTGYITELGAGRLPDL